MGKRTLIGSQAVRQHFADAREPNDVDYMGEGEKSPLVEYHPPIHFLMGKDILSPDELYTLKISHTIRPLGFIKHCKDIMFLKKKGCKILPDILEKLLDYWMDYHGPRIFFDFDKTNEEFFMDGIEREYEHDELHSIVAKFDTPAFNYVKLDQDLADVDKELFLRESDDIKDAICQEEVIVIWYERYQDKRDGILLSAEKCITTLFPDFVGTYALDNFERLYINNDYIKQTLSKLKEM